MSQATASKDAFFNAIADQRGRLEFAGEPSACRPDSLNMLKTKLDEAKMKMTQLINR